ncbi:uncharacterized protein LOC106640954 [Copidosoma floridanum]|uniref:uncharacterized protein LOC106640954 n=1 Tax=Copidosoma floridanum TaxID=29053 RepID=UPI0006C9ADF4|nr:uncharacterized protein LOC106640954 [Copidosoma floridanum]
MIRRSERKRRRPSFFSPSQSRPTSKEKTKHARKTAPQRIFDELPPEMLEMVLRFLTYKEIAGSVRLVSKKCSAVATAILNGAFLSAGPRIRAALEQTDALSVSSKREFDRALFGRVHDCLDVVQSQFDLLKACCWRYTHPTGERSFGRLCFYGGAILDDLDEMLEDAVTRPGCLISMDGPARRIAEFSLTCKTFMNYFEKVSERRVNNTLISGCKAVDVLDCLLIGRELLSCRLSGQRSEPGTAAVSMKVRYVLRRAWFTCLEAPDEQKNATEDSWRDQQRFMYLRLRRLVGIINEHHLERKHYDRELFFSSNALPPPRQLPCSTYSGYGECGGRFYYYGNMNEYAYDSKIIDAWRKNSARDRMQKKVPEDKPCYDLVINVELKCSPELAPLSVR